jgi:hypothetical protein
MDDPADAARACHYLAGMAAMTKLRGGYTAQVDAHGNWIVTDHIQRNGYRICFSGTYEQCKAFAARGIAS